jgi:hypothetical protein
MVDVELRPHSRKKNPKPGNLVIEQFGAYDMDLIPVAEYSKGALWLGPITPPEPPDA